MQPNIEHSAPPWRAQGEAGLPDTLGWWQLEESERQRRAEAAASNEGPLCQDGEPEPYLTREQLTLTFAKLHAAGARPAGDLMRLGRVEAMRLNALMNAEEAGRHEPHTPVVSVGPCGVADHYVGDFHAVISVDGRPVTEGCFINIAAFRAWVQFMWEGRCAERPMETGIAYSTETPTELTDSAMQCIDGALAEIDSVLTPATEGADPKPLDFLEGEAGLTAFLGGIMAKLASARAGVEKAGQTLTALTELEDTPDMDGNREAQVFGAADNCPGELVDDLTGARDALVGKPTADDVAAAHSEAHEPAALHTD